VSRRSWWAWSLCARRFSGAGAQIGGGGQARKGLPRLARPGLAPPLGPSPCNWSVAPHGVLGWLRPPGLCWLDASPRRLCLAGEGLDLVLERAGVLHGPDRDAQLQHLHTRTSLHHSGPSSSGSPFNRRARGSKKAKRGREGLRERGVWCEAVTRPSRVTATLYPTTTFGRHWCRRSRRGRGFAVAAGTVGCREDVGSVVLR